MVQISRVARTFGSHPRYAALRAFGRFDAVRNAAIKIRQLRTRTAFGEFTNSSAEPTLIDLSASANVTIAAGHEDAARALAKEARERGLVTGLDLPQTIVREILEFATTEPCFADREPGLGFHLGRREDAQAAIGKNILVAQYFNTLERCSAVASVANDPFVRSVAGHYLRSVPLLVGVSLWWTFPVEPAEGDQDRHAHRFHRDLDDFDFLKFFFYITDVEPDDGGHICVVGSHDDSAGVPRRLAIRRHSDAEIFEAYAAHDIVELTGPSGTGFAETTRCLHKGLTPTKNPRLVLQLEFAHFDYGVTSDAWPMQDLHMITLDSESAVPA